MVIQSTNRLQKCNYCMCWREKKNEKTAKTMAEEQQVCAKTARIGPMRAKQSDIFAPVKADEEDGKEAAQMRSKMLVLISHVAVSLIRHLKKCHPSEYELQNVLTYTVKSYTDSVRLEYMMFAETLKIEHCWEGLLTWWNHRDHGTERSHTMVFNERVAIHGYKGREKVMRIARTYKPTFGDIEATDKIIRERMTLPYRQKFLVYLARYGLPKCLRMVKLWVWDIRAQMEQAPDPTEDGGAQEQHLRDILATAHDYDGASTFPKIVKEENIRRITAKKRQRCASPPSSGWLTKTMKLDEQQQQQSPPPSVAYVPVTPSPPPPTVQKEEAGRQMGLNSYVVENIVKNMSDEDWLDFLTRRKYGRALIQELQAFLNEKYCNEEHTQRQQHYGELCNRAMYPLYYPPYERDLSARHYHMQQDGEVPSSSAWSMVPQKKKTFFRREFADGSFPVYVSDEEYDRLMFEEREFCVEDHSEPSGYFNTHTLVENPARYALRTRDRCGNEVILRNSPKHEEHY